MRKLVATAVLVVCILGVMARAERLYTHDEILNAILKVESGGRPNPPDGDGGRSIGPYQIGWAYWKDSGVPGDWQRCREAEYARCVVTAYMKRHASAAWQRRDWASLANAHNGGRDWAKGNARKRANLALYRAKIRKALPR